MGMEFALTLIAFIGQPPLCGMQADSTGLEELKIMHPTFAVGCTYNQSRCLLDNPL